MSVLLCDSNCELWHTRLKELGLDVISMPYYVKGQEYYYDMGANTDFRAFYDAVRGKFKIFFAADMPSPLFHVRHITADMATR